MSNKKQIEKFLTALTALSKKHGIGFANGAELSSRLDDKNFKYVVNDWRMVRRVPDEKGRLKPAAEE